MRPPRKPARPGRPPRDYAVAADFVQGYRVHSLDAYRYRVAGKVFTAVSDEQMRKRAREIIQEQPK